jgi:hypothetical protein
MDASRCLFSTIRDGLFIQECLSPTTGSDDEEGNPFLPHVDAKACCRILISLDAARTWNLSQAGRLDLTREAKRDWFSDPEFDREVFLIGPQARALAVLTPVMRKKFVALIDPVWGQVSLQCDPLAVQLMPDLSSLRLPQPLGYSRDMARAGRRLSIGWHDRERAAGSQASLLWRLTRLRSAGGTCENL